MWRTKTRLADLNVVLGVLINGGVKTLRPLAVWRLYAHSCASSGTCMLFQNGAGWLRLRYRYNGGGMFSQGRHRTGVITGLNKVQRNKMGIKCVFLYVKQFHNFF